MIGKKARKDYPEARFYKLIRTNEAGILGVVALEDIVYEKRIQIRLIANSVENQGRGKYYDGIAGCMIAYVCNEALNKYSADACVSLQPKTRLRSHYMTKYGMISTGEQVCIDGEALIDIIKKYKP